MYDLKYLQKEVKKEITEKRYMHTLGVKDTAACLAMRYGVNLEAAQAAGLLHDYCKCIGDEEMLARCRKRDLPVTEAEHKSPYLLHGKLAASYAERRFGITDPDILGAITWHTTGKPAMSMLEMIVFTADYIEPGRREIPGLAEVRSMAFRDMEEAVYMILQNTLDYLEEDSDKKIDPVTYNAHAYYKTLHESRQTKGEL